MTERIRGLPKNVTRVLRKCPDGPVGKLTALDGMK